ncbi:MAG TPA: TonB-dependent receptor [Steroidobacteraceae bacterium]|nr:TonB-dependent receptor [Steroidobacteraceae bacterium]
MNPRLASACRRSLGSQGALALATVFSLPAVAQEAAPPDEPIEVVVVIGTPGGGGTDRQEASFAVTTIDSEELEKISPQSTADLVKSIPGVWAESSGGIAGANIDVRGLPGGGDAPFVTFAINGSPLYGTEMLSFFEQSSIFRTDETIARVEGLRGGPNAVFGKGEPGLTVNFNLLEGSDETEGRIKYSGSDFDLQRLDARLSGALADDFYYMIGGYIQSSPGIRDAQFTAEEGNQFTVNLTKRFDNGRVNVFTRMTDDHGQWVLPFSLNAGLDLGSFAQIGNATRFRQLQIDAAGDTEIYDFAQGRGWDGNVSGGSAEFDVGGGVTIRDQFTFMEGDADTYGFVPSGGAVTAGAVSAVTGAPVTTVSGRTLAAGDFVQTYGHWVVQKDLEALINDISLNKMFAERHDVTFGYYYATWSSDDFWTIGNPIPVHNADNGEPLNPAITPANIAAAGGDAGFLFGLKSGGDARAEALYLADSWQITDALRLDLGVRNEDLTLDYVLDTAAANTSFPDGVVDTTTHLTGNEWAYTGAVNFDFTDELGTFVRYSSGFLWPHFDDIRENRNTVDEVEQVEAGLKYSTPTIRAYATAFYNTNDAFASTVGGVLPPTAFQTEAYGVEFDGALYFGPVLISFLGTLQSTEITDSTTPTDVGNQVLRQPEWQARLSPSWTFETANVNTTVYAGLNFIGERWDDNANTIKLDSYEKIDVGVMVNTAGGLYFQVHGDNITDSDGLTEGDPRNPAAPNGRPIFGRSVVFSVGYDF